MMKVWEGPGIKIKCTPLVQGHLDTARLILAKMTSMLRCLSAFLIILLALSCVISAAPSEPQYPGEQATPEQLAEYYNNLYQYITFITRPRFGKRWNEIGVEDVPSY